MFRFDLPKAFLITESIRSIRRCSIMSGVCVACLIPPFGIYVSGNPRFHGLTELYSRVSQTEKLGLSLQYLKLGVIKKIF